ncbi:hypothetical protein CVD28_11610 [Bacillus sp. M6-12]|nr:hypothetical protein CVD28_11610 [Bacillus sp. M6-12]
MNAWVVGLLFLIPGLIFFIFVLLNYTEEEHWKEVKKWEKKRYLCFLGRTGYGSFPQISK